MTELRNDLIDAAARAIHHKQINAYESCADCGSDAEVALDAMLDLLTERAGDWWEAWSQYNGDEPEFIGLVEVLRESGAGA